MCQVEIGTFGNDLISSYLLSLHNEYQTKDIYERFDNANCVIG